MRADTGEFMGLVEEAAVNFDAVGAAESPAKLAQSAPLQVSITKVSAIARLASPAPLPVACAGWPSFSKPGGWSRAMRIEMPDHL